ncbi:hypothetical protein E0L21_12025 [Kosakonia quasisacchari]|uniref:Uncharacterized protein n=1 Tax=Kosakonia quasisacchari TaxID=2529380 RepID=A0A4R0H887_9ENTR|nr:hypothetical protein [Kosakonia quasisacchari]TCC07135.1 hypothetical protein E0L21_12025 [Kosakonia quasisacchari]
MHSINPTHQGLYFVVASFLLSCCASAASATDFSGQWHGSERNESTLTLKLSQLNNKLTGSYCFITQRGNRIDCPDEQQDNLRGDVKNNTATITFDSSFGGKNGKATLVVNGDKLAWHLTQPPEHGDYYAPENYALVKEVIHNGATTKIIRTDSFMIAIRNNCGAFTTPCDDLLYTGARNRDRQQISLRGKTRVDAANRVVGAEFHNGDVLYLVDYNPLKLVVTQAGKTLVNQAGSWLK